MILDTDFIIDVMNKENFAVEKLQRLSAYKAHFRVSAPTIFELWVGIALSKMPRDERMKVESALSDFDVLQLSLSTAQKAGEIHGTLLKARQEIDVVDSMIAGIALLENETVLTRNVKHFSRVRGLRVESY